MTPAERKAIAALKAAGFKGQSLRTAWAIAKRESRFDPRAINNTPSTKDLSYGLFQINLFGSLAGRVQQYGLKSADDLLDPVTNAKVAYKLSKGGTDWGHWGVGPNAYRTTAPLDTSGFQGGGVQPLTVAAPTAAGTVQQQPVAAARVGPAAKAVTLRTLNQLARQHGFKNFAQAYGIPAKQARELARSATIASSPVDPSRVAFRAKPTAPATSTRTTRTPQASAGGEKGGVAELFYDPAGKGQQWSPGWTNPIGGHSDHVHVSFASPQAALQLIQFAKDMGLRVGENPYTDPVDGNHVSGSFHGQLFSGTYDGRQLGRAIDVSGPASQMMAFYRLARKYI